MTDNGLRIPSQSFTTAPPARKLLQNEIKVARAEDEKKGSSSDDSENMDSIKEPAPRRMSGNNYLQKIIEGDDDSMLNNKRVSYEATPVKHTLKVMKASSEQVPGIKKQGIGAKAFLNS